MASISKEQSLSGEPPTLGSDAQLEALLRDHHMFPSEDETLHRQRMFESIKDTVNRLAINSNADTRLNMPFVVVPTGSYGLAVWDPSSAMDCLVIGTISPAVFLALMAQKLRRPEGEEITVLAKTKAASGTMLQLQAGVVRFNLHYCAATRVTESWPRALKLPPSDPVFDIPMQSLLSLNSVRDLDYLQRTIPDLAAFRLAYRSVKSWARHRGIYSSNLGYLDEIHITLLLARVCKASFREGCATSTSEIICEFFRYYAHVDWKKEIIYDPTYYSHAPDYHRSYREPLVILSINPPKVNVAQTATVSSVKTLEEEFKRAEELISRPGATWVDVTGTDSKSTGYEDFLKAYPNYIKLDANYWGGAQAKWRKLVGWLELRCVHLFGSINRMFPGIHTRIWPGLFTESEEGQIENQTEFRGCFLIGLAKNENIPNEHMNVSDRDSAHISLLALLTSFAEQVRRDETYFDKYVLWADATFVKQSELKSVGLCDPDWANIMAHDGENLDLDDAFEDIEINSIEVETFQDSRYPQQFDQATPSVHVAAGPKLRPAEDVINRLRWDPSFDSTDYVVGYMDRFVGAKEVPISLWKSEQTDEEFIPMHRVLYFKRRSDGQRVWDREKKIDLIFNTAGALWVKSDLDFLPNNDGLIAEALQRRDKHLGRIARGPDLMRRFSVALGMAMNLRWDEAKVLFQGITSTATGIPLNLDWEMWRQSRIYQWAGDSRLQTLLRLQDGNIENKEMIKNIQSHCRSRFSTCSAANCTGAGVRGQGCPSCEVYLYEKHLSKQYHTCPALRELGKAFSASYVTAELAPLYSSNTKANNHGRLLPQALRMRALIRCFLC